MPQKHNYIKVKNGKLTFNVLEIPVGTDDLTKLSDELNKEYQDANAKKKK